MPRQATKKDIQNLANLANKMWRNHSTKDLEKQFLQDINNNESAIFLKEYDNKIIGFAMCQLRVDYVEGTNSSPVGYLEGIFIDEDFRHKGYAKELLSKCEEWANKQGCSEFASDCELDNNESFNFHIKNGFEEMNRIICFKKDFKAENKKKNDTIQIQSNLLKNLFKNVFFINGTAYAGKSTMIKLLAEKYNGICDMVTDINPPIYYNLN